MSVSKQACMQWLSVPVKQLLHPRMHSMIPFRSSPLQ